MSEEIPEAFYRRVDDDTFEATALTRGQIGRASCRERV